jgi:hypothetical protein
MVIITRKQLESIGHTQRQLFGESSCRFHGPLSLLHYWQGRVQMARNEREDAKKHFNASMTEIESNLHFHYAGQLSGVMPDDERMIYAGYALASAMGFGVAQLSHVSGDLNGALALLRPAVALLMGTGDNYRRGYARMLIGAAERALAGKDPERLKSAIGNLTESLELFAGPLRHGLHEARCRHQLALAYTYWAQNYPYPSTKRSDKLDQASEQCRLAQGALKQYINAGFADPELVYDLHLTNSRVLRERGEYVSARDSVLAALRIAEDYRYAPDSSKAKCHVALAEIFLSEFSEQVQSLDTLSNAEHHLQEAATCSAADIPLSCVIQLYEARLLARQKQMSKARQKYQEVALRIARGVQNGWVFQLAIEVGNEVEPHATEFALNLEQLEKEVRAQAAQSNKSFWDTAIERLETFMIEWAEGTMEHESYLKLGIKRGRWFNIKKRLKTDRNPTN